MNYNEANELRAKLSEAKIKATALTEHALAMVRSAMEPHAAHGTNQLGKGQEIDVAKYALDDAILKLGAADRAARALRTALNNHLKQAS
jgi:hypothetical protein